MTDGRLHTIGSVWAFEHAGSGPHSQVVLFIGGLGDRPQSIPYVNGLAKALDADGWGVVEAALSSSGLGWGLSSLKRDAAEIGQVVAYLAAAGKTKIVLMGHSTGCQDTMEYLCKPPADGPAVAGAILQAPVSDREAMALLFPETSPGLLAEAEAAVAAGRGREVLPQKYSDLFFNSPITAERWVSLAAVRGADDYFSSDLGVATWAATFGRLDASRTLAQGGRLLVLYSGEDDFVPPSVDKQALVDAWAAACPVWSPLSTVVPGANHRAEAAEATATVVGRVAAFVRAL
ncbi:uncharacterized protein V1510DRAFT_411340 [Dipodascopsis tothii]|uniref:uncharacterized protein n=1 Tax=Dipodascopsis tothii TaxID=44089 RepID=UPI0034CDB5A0